MTRWDGVFIGAAAAALGDAEELRHAVSAGRYDARDHERDSYRAVRVAPGGALPRMVLQAAGLARRRSGVAASDIDLVVHTFAGQARDAGRAEHVSRELACTSATAMEVVHASNGGLVALHLVAAYLSASTAMRAALLTTVDCAAGPGTDSYRTERGTVLGDGATGLVVTTGTGVARVLSTTVLGDAPEGALVRADLAWRVPKPPARRWKRAGGGGGRPAPHAPAPVLAEREREVLELALSEAGARPADVVRFVFPNLGRHLQGWSRRAALGIHEDRTTWGWGTGVGHLRSGDQTAGLAHLLEAGELSSGDLVVLVGGVCGRSLGCAVLEMT
ncbi:3-oxoacyl-[acyl-carrier-protein] synthase III C-terminal domain-containing protein [Streptomyces sp. NPDC090127]|uniref:3-oxoacyl-[acyl-carrier-protein] synthase III C-terminal domain-containing protein n=1 Tax=Streptomyces sp. NPDC090127 TaxID=3365953 RepID=UPI0038274543